MNDIQHTIDHHLQLLLISDILLFIHLYLQAIITLILLSLQLLFLRQSCHYHQRLISIILAVALLPFLLSSLKVICQLSLCHLFQHRNRVLPHPLIQPRLFRQFYQLVPYLLNHHLDLVRCFYLIIHQLRFPQCLVHPHLHHLRLHFHHLHINLTCMNSSMSIVVL